MKIIYQFLLIIVAISIKQIELNKVGIKMGLIADFSISVSEGYSPLTINFTQNCLGSPTYFKWHYGDGDSAENIENTQHTYIKPGIYSPILEIRKNSDFDALTKNNYIIVNQPLSESENIIIESYQNNGSKDWKFYIDQDMYLIFNVGGDIYKSGTPVIKDGVWTLVEFHSGTNQFYVSTVNEGRKKIPTYNISAGSTGMHIEDKLLVASNSSIKIDELRVVKKEENLSSYFRSLESTVYYLPS
jgi:PKD repeat protein